METLTITHGAYKIMENESLAHDTETGGSLVGPIRHPIVIRATRAGIKAAMSYASYTNDADFDTNLLDEIIHEYNGRIKLLGFWHKHPYGYDKPSGIDLKTAIRIVQRNAGSGDSRKHYFIITNVNIYGLFSLRCYALKPGQENFEEMIYSLVHNDDEMVTKAIEREPVIPLTRTMNYWNDDDFSFHLTPNGRERLFDEIQDLREKGYRVRVFQGKRVQVLIEGKVNVICHMPPEYPLNPPRLFYGDYEIPYPLHVWNSTLKIIDLLEKIQYNVGEKRRIHEINHYERKFKTIALLERIKQKITHLWPCSRR